ncbi:hypothetical protein PHMEG_000799 [Phytophthora megakarya]|uniref:Uncharacterized protein n=1 Tax=Phytophthora megakarya TaxID=4795 RepID=A0A225X4L0_9STRA|nr:hypothetical protein PHMEG_000799 [Phytophthora megakarya]
MALNRNFRTTYYKTLGVPVVQHIVDVDASFATLLNERAVNVPQLLKLALELGIAPQFRARSWLLLAGVLPPYPSVWTFALKERRVMFEDVVGAAQVLQLKDVTDGEGRGEVYDFMELLAEEDEKPRSRQQLKRLVHLHRTYWKEIAYDFMELLAEEDEKPRSRQQLKRLVHLHRTYWREIVNAPLLCGMDDPNFLLGLARVFVDPVVTLNALYEAPLVEFEVVFLRTLDVKRRRLTADGSLS